MPEPGRMIHPFDAYLPHPETAKRLVAASYDSLTEDRPPADEGPLGFLDVIRWEVDRAPHDEAYRRNLLAAAAVRLRDLLAGDDFVHRRGPAFLVCRLHQGGHTQTGVIADVSLAAYDDGRIKVHESTRTDQEDRLVEYLDEVGATFLPLFLIHREEPAVATLVADVAERPPDLECTTGDGLTQTVWVVDDPREVARFTAALDRIPGMYIADGHHRAASAARHARARATGGGAEGARDRVVAVLFPADELRVHEYNRWAELPPDLAPDDLVARLRERFRVAPADGRGTPRAAGEVGVLVDGRWYRLHAPLELRRRPLPDSLDVAILHDEVLGPLLGVTDASTDSRLGFVPGTLGAGEVERLCAGRHRAGFLLYPTAVADLLAVSDRGALMPPKSTWFAPKLRSGLVIRVLD